MSRTHRRRDALFVDGRLIHPPLAIVALLAWTALVVLQISTSAVGDPRVLVVVIVALLAVSTWCFAARSRSVFAATGALLIGLVVGFVAEYVGTHTGHPFGRYDYTGRLLPQLGSVPIVVPVAWFAMGLPAYAIATVVVPSGHGSRTGVGRCAVGAFALAAWDLFLDPQMTGLGYWTWPGGGLYFGVPVSNYAGWFAVSVVLMVLLGLAFDRPPRPASRGLLGLYTSMAIVETVGFLGPLAWRPQVAVIGACGMGVPAAVAWLRIGRTRRERAEPEGD